VCLCLAWRLGVHWLFEEEDWQLEGARLLRFEDASGSPLGPRLLLLLDWQGVGQRMVERALPRREAFRRQLLHVGAQQREGAG
jgi:hypothetical protein